jgi:hypothetical protein
MESLMRQRLDLADDLLRDRLQLADTAPLKQEIMVEWEIVLHQMPYVGGAESRMTDFFMPCQGENQWMVMSNSLSASTIALTRGI